MFRLTCFILTLGLLGLGGCSQSVEEVNCPAEVKLRLELRTETPVISSAADARFVIHLVNDGTEPVTVVLPGDGSLWGLRTPIMRWNPSMNLGTLRCGNVNGLKANEVVTIRAGESVPLRYVYGPDLTESGIHHVSLELENVPDLKWGGLPTPKHDAPTMERVRRTVPFKIASNVVDVEVQK